MGGGGWKQYVVLVGSSSSGAVPGVPLMLLGGPFPRSGSCHVGGRARVLLLSPPRARVLETGARVLRGTSAPLTRTGDDVRLAPTICISCFPFEGEQACSPDGAGSISSQTGRVLGRRACWIRPGIDTQQLSPCIISCTRAHYSMLAQQHIYILERQCCRSNGMGHQTVQCSSCSQGRICCLRLSRNYSCCTSSTSLSFPSSRHGVACYTSLIISS